MWQGYTFSKSLKDVPGTPDTTRAWKNSNIARSAAPDTTTNSDHVSALTRRINTFFELSDMKQNIDAFMYAPVRMRTLARTLQQR